MTAVLALIHFELRRRWLAFAVALVSGLLAFGMPLLPTLAGSHTNELRSVMATVSAIGLAALLALALGASLAAGDLAEHRATFLFSRPIGWPTIAISRFVAAFIVVLGSTALVLLPSLLAGARLEIPTPRYGLIEFAGGATLLIGGSFLLLLLASAALVSARARTAWTVLELTAFVTAGLIFARALHLVREIGLPFAEAKLLLWIFASSTLALVLMYLAAVGSGRTDLGRAHRAQALVGAGMLLLTSSGALRWTHDYLTPSLDDVWPGPLVARPLTNEIFALAGEEPGRFDLSTTFLFDGASGEWLRVRQANGRESGASVVAAGGNGFAFWRREGGGARLEIARLARDGFAASPTALVLDRIPLAWTVSADAARLVSIVPLGNRRGLRLDTYEIAGGRLLASTILPRFYPWHARLAREDDGFRLAFWVSSASELESWRIDSSGRAHRTASRSFHETEFEWHLDESHRRILVKRHGKFPNWLLVDVVTLEPIAELRPPLVEQSAATLSPVVALFPDGTIGISARTATQRELDLYSNAGDLLRSSTAPIEGLTDYLGIGANHTILLAMKPTEGRSDDSIGWTIERYDLASGARQSVARDLLPLSRSVQSSARPVLLRDAAGDLIALDPASGSLTRLARPRGVD